MKIKFILFVLFVLSCYHSFSQDWQYAGSSQDGDKYYIRDAGNSDVGYKKYWMKTVAKNLSYFKNSKKIKLTNGYSMELFEYNCSSKQVKLLSIYHYYASGKVANSFTIPFYRTEWRDVLPDSVGEMVLDRACALF
jgi:hypothetical protein